MKTSWRKAIRAFVKRKRRILPEDRSLDASSAVPTYSSSSGSLSEAMQARDGGEDLKQGRIAGPSRSIPLRPQSTSIATIRTYSVDTTPKSRRRIVGLLSGRFDMRGEDSAIRGHGRAVQL